MAVVYENSYGWILDHLTFINKGYDRVKDGNNYLSFSFKEELFNINSPFMMDSQFEKHQRRQDVELVGDNQNHTQIVKTVDDNPKPGKRKRKLSKMFPPDSNENRYNEYHSKIVEFISEAFASLLSEVKDKNIFLTNVMEDNNKEARHFSNVLGPGDSLREPVVNDNAVVNKIQDLVEKDKVQDLVEKGEVQDLESKVESKLELSQLYNKLYTNGCESSIKINIGTNSYLIPSQSSFIMGDVQNLKHFTNVMGESSFDFILLDPPWENKSVKRKKQYWTMRNEELFQIPVPSLSAPSALIAVWVTNKLRHINFVMDELFPFWNIRHMATWYWLKMTKSGKLVYDIESEHKKPYELLILGRFDLKEDQKACVGTPSLSSSFTNNQSKRVLNQKVIISVPCAIHSMKVCLNDVITPYLPKNPKCLEIFARNLSPGWYSVGNEVIKHQHCDYFDKTIND